MPTAATVAYLEARSTRDPAELQEKLEAALYALSLAREECEDHVTQEDHDKAVSDLQDEVSDLEQERDKLDESIEEYRRAAEDVRRDLTKALDRIAKHDAEMARAKAKEEQAYAASKRWQDEARKAEDEACAMRNRMAAWLEDATAVKTADHYYERYQQTRAELAKYRSAVQSAINAAHHAAGRSKVKHETLSMLVEGIRNEERKPVQP